MTRTSLTALGLVLAFPALAATRQYTTKHYHFPRTLGLVRTHASAEFIANTERKSFLDDTTPIPGKADVSAQVSLPENQGMCGSCWDFSLTKALRSAYMVAGKDPGVLAFNYLLDNCGPGPSQGACHGGDFNAAGNFLNGAGPWLESEDPYRQRKTRCKNLPTVATAVSYAMLGTPATGPTFKDLAYAVGVEGQMVSIDVAASKGDWGSYSSGIYDNCAGGSGDIDHMIDLVGYDCETSVDSSGSCVFTAEGKPVNGDGYLIVENNWGENWGTTAANGHGGYMKMRMYDASGNRCNAVATDALIYDVK